MADAAVLEAERLRRQLRAAEPAAAERPEAIHIVRAPGRVNLIGEHTDYNDGFVLPAAIDLEIWIALLPTHDRRVRLTLAGGERAELHLDAIGPPRGGWIDYVAGVAWSLGQAGVPVTGFRGVLASSLPISAGLSSSAALELTAAWALCGGERPPLAEMDLARAAQRAENEYVGVRCGPMDQFAVTLGHRDAALLLDCRSLEWHAVPLPMGDHRLVVCETGATRRLVASEYNARRAECEAAVTAAAAADPRVRSLRDLDLEALGRLRGRLDPTALRRAEHVIGENDRVLATVRALERGDLATVGRLFAESHASLRDRFEVSSPELDALVEIAAATPGVVAARMTGAGFGGCTVNLVTAGAVGGLRRRIAADYPARTGRQATVHVVRPTAGAGRLATEPRRA